MTPSALIRLLSISLGLLLAEPSQAQNLLPSEEGDRCRYEVTIQMDKGYFSEKTGDLQKIDVGIALCHFVMGLKEHGNSPEVVIADPGIAVPDGVEYIATAITRD